MSLYCVIGMHRSGTSAATRVLNLLGVSLGSEERLMVPQPDNPTGFWEAAPASRLNERTLRAMGGSWDDPPLLQPGWQDADTCLPWIQEAREVIAEVVSDGADAHAIKDPRLSLTLPLWVEAARPAGVVMAVRDPVGVCQSLWRRNGIDLERGLALWLRYVWEAVVHSPDPVTVDYQQLLRSPRETTTTLAANLGLDEPNDSQLIEVTEFLDRDLNHQDESTPLPSSPTLDLADALYALIRAGDVRGARRCLEAVEK